MCGIGGIYMVGNDLLPTEATEAMFKALDDRGGHASGVAWLWQGADTLQVFKGARTARSISSQAMAKVGRIVRYAMFHTRYTTQGSTSNNGNNHPIVGHGITLTHNGVLSNDRQVFDYLGVKRLYEVDSEAINAVLSQHTVEILPEMIHGSMSIAWVDSTVCNQTVNLFTNGRNPLVIGRTVEGHVVWASNLYHLDSFNLESHFNAQPFKHYWVGPSGVIESRWVSDRRSSPRVLGRNSHVASYGDFEPSTAFKSSSATSGPKSSTKAVKTPSRAENLIVGGWLYDAEREEWRKAAPADYRRGGF